MVAEGIIKGLNKLHCQGEFQHGSVSTWLWLWWSESSLGFSKNCNNWSEFSNNGYHQENKSTHKFTSALQGWVFAPVRHIAMEWSQFCTPIQCMLWSLIMFMQNIVFSTRSVTQITSSQLIISSVVVLKLPCSAVMVRQLSQSTQNIWRLGLGSGYFWVQSWAIIHQLWSYTNTAFPLVAESNIHLMSFHIHYYNHPQWKLNPRTLFRNLFSFSISIVRTSENED